MASDIVHSQSEEFTALLKALKITEEHITKVIIVGQVDDVVRARVTRIVSLDPDAIDYLKKVTETFYLEKRNA